MKCSQRPAWSISQQQSIERAVQQPVESARQVVSLWEVNKIEIRELIMPYEENIKKMLKELDEEEVQQPVAEEVGNAGKPNTDNLYTIIELFKHMQRLLLYSILCRAMTSCCWSG